MVVVTVTHFPLVVPGGWSGRFWGRVGGVGGLLEGVGSKPKCREPATRGGFVSWPTAEQQMLFNIQAKRLCASQQQQQEQQQHWQHSNPQPCCWHSDQGCKGANSNDLRKSS